MIISRLSILLLVLVAGGCFGGAAGPELPLAGSSTRRAAWPRASTTGPDWPVR